VRIYFYASVEVAEEDFGDWETESDGEDLSDFVADELTRSSVSLAIYEASRRPFTRLTVKGGDAQ
jgi:hypothetical protein